MYINSYKILKCKKEIEPSIRATGPERFPSDRRAISLEIYIHRIVYLLLLVREIEGVYRLGSRKRDMERRIRALARLSLNVDQMRGTWNGYLIIIPRSYLYLFHFFPPSESIQATTSHTMPFPFKRITFEAFNG